MSNTENRPVDERIRSLVKLYEKDVITMRELSDQIALWAVYPEFFQHMDLVPSTVISQLQEYAQQAPAHPEDVFILRSDCSTGDFNHDAAREERERWYWCARRLRQHFFPNLPLPPFEPITLIGGVTESIEVNGVVFIIGEFGSHLVRRNPIHLIPPAGPRIVTSVIGEGFIKRDGDQDSTDTIVRQWGHYGLYLGKNVRSPLETPPGTEVWVDRTAVADVREHPLGSNTSPDSY
jgi:hypothetical protein